MSDINVVVNDNVLGITVNTNPNVYITSSAAGIQGPVGPSGASGGSQSSLNGLTGAVNLSGNQPISVYNSGNNIFVS